MTTAATIITLLASCSTTHAFTTSSPAISTRNKFTTSQSANTIQLKSSSSTNRKPSSLNLLIDPTTTVSSSSSTVTRKLQNNALFTKHKTISRSRGDSTTKLNAASVAAATATKATSSGTAAVMGVISGGIIGGALHAIAGPDHLAALLPRCCGQRWYRAGRIGALWGMGHGVSATLLGLTAFGLKNRISGGRSLSLLSGASSFMELAVGASLIFIGVLGIKEAREWEEEIEENTIVGGDDAMAQPQSLSAAAVTADAGAKNAQKRAVIFNGILHGFSWDGAPSLAPALAVATWRGSISFLLSYALGTMAAMTITTTLIGESTRRAGEVFNRPDIPQKLSLVSSFIAMGVGAFWCFLALK